jgi:hypothetical protein
LPARSREHFEHVVADDVARRVIGPRQIVNNSRHAGSPFTRLQYGKRDLVGNKDALGRLHHPLLALLVELQPCAAREPAAPNLRQKQSSLMRNPSVEKPLAVASPGST